MALACSSDENEEENSLALQLPVHNATARRNSEDKSDGHAYVIDVLKYCQHCRKILSYLKNFSKQIQYVVQSLQLYRRLKIKTRSILGMAVQAKQKIVPCQDE